MISPENFYNILKKSGFNFYTGVPDSLLKDFCAYVSDHTEKNEHVIAANEGNAIALAAGHFLGNKKPGFVYMQNSGIGNTINPLLSLVDADVYSIPMMLMIGWRGEPGMKDEPQHIKQGRIMTQLLDVLEIPWVVIDAKSDAETILNQAVGTMLKKMSPVAIIVRKGTFKEYKSYVDTNHNYPMTREQAICTIVDALLDKDIVVSTTGMSSRELYECRVAKGTNPSNDFLTVGSMGHASSIALGLASTQLDRRVICIDGDGSLIMHMGSLPIIAQMAPSNLVHIVINNGAHDSVGGQPTVGLDMNLVAMANACGYKKAVSVKSVDKLRQLLLSNLDFKGPILIEIPVRKGYRDNLGRPQSSPIENRKVFMARLGC
jgi:phosphonopyruvate decarboxylase